MLQKRLKKFQVYWYSSIWVRKVGKLVSFNDFVLKGGYTFFDVEHMSCSFEFWTQKDKKVSTNFYDRLMAIYGLRIFIATFKMDSQTNWANRAKIFMIVKGVDWRAVQKIVTIRPLWPIQAENGNKNTQYIFLLPPWKCTAKLVQPTKLKFSGPIFQADKGWKWQ